MNVIISAIALKFFFEHLYSLKIELSTRFKVFMFIGLLSPLGDYIIRYLSKIPLTQEQPVYFQSIVYHFGFWSLIVFLNWVIFRDIKRSLRYYAPIIGLTIYSAFTLLSTLKLPFFYPLIKQGYSLNLVNNGYFFPTCILIVIWLIKKTLVRKSKIMNWSALVFMVCYLLFSMGIKGAMKSNLPEPFNKASVIDIRPADHLQTKWVIFSQFQDRYYFTTYRVFSGWDKEINNQFKYQDIDLVQNLLLNPKIRALYFDVFHNPILKIEFQRDNLLLELSEPAPSFDLFWLQTAKIVLNSSGQIMTYQTSYSFMNWNLLTFNI